MSFHDLAALLLAADDDGTVCEAGSDWNVDPVELTAGKRSVWGREPTWTPAGAGLLQYAARREGALTRLRTRPPGQLSVVGVHRWSPDFVQARRLPRTLSWLRAGLLVELTTDVRSPRVIDVAATAAGLTQRVDRMHFGAGDQINARGQLEGGQQMVLRVARGGSPAEPLQAAGALARLEPLGLPHVPRLLGRGDAGTVAWTTETLLPGRRPDALSPELGVEVADFCARLPRGASPPAAFASDIASLIDRLPRFREPLRELEMRAAPAIATLPSVLRHGDLWLGNLLVERGLLTGVVDWDAWHPSGVPGTDLLHLVASAYAVATRQSFGELMRERPWELSLFTAAAKDYWNELCIAPTRETLEAIGIAWWTMHATGNLQRHPHMANDERWLRTSVESLLGKGGSRPLRRARRPR
ncbi:MAG: aminoglycoside phosphotransferase family protein [Solirubrobacteraceae bacterium]